MGAILDKAIVFATKAHQGQFQKGTKIPYIVHPLEAGAIVATMNTDDEVIAAAVLHDVLEDAATTEDDILQIFGERILNLVKAESENKRDNLLAESTWEIRKQENLTDLKNASIEAKMIALGDKLSNIRAIHRDYDTIGDALWQRFNQKDPRKHEWYYSGIAVAIAELENTQAYQEYNELVEKTFCHVR